METTVREFNRLTNTCVSSYQLKYPRADLPYKLMNEKVVILPLFRQYPLAEMFYSDIQIFF